MNKKIILIFLILIVTQSLVSAEYGYEDFIFHLNELNQEGTLTQELIDNLENLSPEQKLEIIESIISSDSDKFWNQWKDDLTGKQKRDLLKDLGSEARNKFTKKYGEKYGVIFINLGDENVKFADDNIIGNRQGYFQMDKIEEYNQNNPNNKITTIEYKQDGETSSLIFKKVDGNTLDLTVGKSKRGFYFNPDSGYIGRVGKDGLINKEDQFTGKWNGLGNLKIDATNTEVKMSFDFNRNSQGEANDPRNFPKFSNSEDSYSTFQHPSGKGEDGKTKYDLKSGELTFDENGRLKSANNMYKNKGEKSWGGFFGEETAITYNKNAFDATKGSKVMIDLENGEIKAEVKRVQEGIAGDIKNKIDNIKDKMVELKNKLGDNDEKIKLGIGAITTAENLLGLAKLTGNANSIKLAENGLIFAENEVKKEIAEIFNLKPDDPLVKAIATKGNLNLISQTLNLASTATGAAGDLANLLSNKAGAVKNPLFSSLNPAEGTRINLQLSNPATRQLKNVEMYSGSLDITDSEGKLARVVNTATTHGYVIPSIINRGARNFGNIDFTLHNKNYKGGQNIKIFSQNGNLNAIGIGGFQNLESVKGEYVINAGGGISYRYKIFFFGDEGRKDEYNNVLTADYQTSTENKRRANEFKKQANDQYSKLYHEYKGNNDKNGNNVWTQNEIKELNTIWDNNYIRYNEILNSGDIVLSVRSSELSQSLNLLSKVDEKSKVSDPNEIIDKEKSIIDKINEQTFLSNKNVQRQLSQRGIGFSGVNDFVQTEIKNILIHLKSNPSNTLKFIKDSRNGLYQIRTDRTTYTIDPIAGPFISNILPVIAGSGRSDKNGNLDIDTENSRFGQTIGIFVNGGHYEGIRESLRARRNANSIKYGIQSTAERIVKQKLADPASKGYQEYTIHSPTY